MSTVMCALPSAALEIPLSTEALCEWGVEALLEGYQAGSFTPSQVVEAYLARIDRLDPILHSYVLVLHDAARAQARTSDARYANGTARALEGLPIALKDLIDVQGHDTTAGSVTRRGQVARTDATITQRLRDAGAVLLGKVHTVEFAYGSWGENEHMGTPLNPWRLDMPHTPGGSSSGSGVVVAAGLAPVAIGTDTGGSVRLPAAFNGVVGLKATFGRISGYGVAPLSQTLDSPGVLARSVPDAARVFEVLQGHDAQDSRTWSLPALQRNTGPIDALSDLRLGCLCALDREGIDAEVLAAYDVCLEELQALGATLQTIAFAQPLLHYGASAAMPAEAFALYGDLARDPAYPMDRGVRERILAGDMAASEYLQRREAIRQQSVEYHRHLAGFDAFLLPTTQVPAVPLATLATRGVASGLTRFANLFGLCGVALPSGYNTEGLPLSLQILCPGYQEHVAIRLASALEQLTAHERHYPVL